MTNLFDQNPEQPASAGGMGAKISDPAATQPLPPQPPEDIFAGVVSAPKKQRHVWPWIAGTAAVVIAAGVAGTAWYFSSHALPGVSLWGESMAGKSEAQIEQFVTERTDAAKVNVSYNNQTHEVTLPSLNVKPDAAAIADQVMNAKRSGNVFVRYMPWSKLDVNATIDASHADASKLNAMFGIDTHDPEDATVALNEDHTKFVVTDGLESEGVAVQPVTDDLLRQVYGDPNYSSKPITGTREVLEPAVTTAMAQQAADTLNHYVEHPISFTINGTEFAKIDPVELEKLTTIAPKATLGASSSATAEAKSTSPVKVTNAKDSSDSADAQQKPNTATNDDPTKVTTGGVTFDVQGIHDYFVNNVQPKLVATKEDRDVITNNYGEVIKVNAEGHPGVKLANDAANDIVKNATALLNGKAESIDLKGDIDPMNTKTSKRHVVVDLSDHKVYVYENDKLIRSFNMSAGRDNDYATGACKGDLCTPLGDYKVWLKYESQNMSGNIKLSNGKEEKWNAPNVGFVNYFSHSGCAIHRIATDSAMSDAGIVGLGNTSHGCVGIGWDVAEWFYKFAIDGTSVHIQQ
ncbi:L,D-transpeptidase catalytic domain-containing protein [Bifidobacterium dolichotidis]|uniref:L,D-transpeptidase catalytic domain-containing protein n=1 Tax=Bifidobacterium dolichotidis TaxID=2306976 RepID=A0A430FSX9_9BIFI|nr:L,D-transpeptidase [Bifidobacterium dolichotidis]RSX55959.1 L,D-transpeptidase catalytic domain-containing protein [Bifidobacterium dolichotidis]